MIARKSVSLKGQHWLEHVMRNEEPVDCCFLFEVRRRLRTQVKKQGVPLCLMNVRLVSYLELLCEWCQVFCWVWLVSSEYYEQLLQPVASAADDFPDSLSECCPQEHIDPKTNSNHRSGPDTLISCSCRVYVPVPYCHTVHALCWDLMDRETGVSVFPVPEANVTYRVRSRELFHLRWSLTSRIWPVLLCSSCVVTFRVWTSLWCLWPESGLWGSRVRYERESSCESTRWVKGEWIKLCLCFGRETRMREQSEMCVSLVYGVCVFLLDLCVCFSLRVKHNKKSVHENLLLPKMTQIISSIFASPASIPLVLTA